MPYYIYRIEPPLILTHLDTKGSYQEARGRVRDLRATRGADDTTLYRMIFAHHEAEAERLLSIPRDERVIGED
ncbi:hypothetical protein [Thiococcus pfennigii]|jgi:hypothetical protein|uniref:hypothetical protein n=1 Tax=Thiococcus pfennigii TaxID=1057 RepID=UPI001906D577|nr:hypothetical protein [Thiococcus pfennigii]MBK1701756.1 hypothetical protein [Thiococcus pfennigii]MBK1730273.1 hypothetical protein [Thiococcus pfennigii]